MLRHYEVLFIVSNGYPSVRGRLPTRYSPVRRFPLKESSEDSSLRFSLDLHVLGTPPAFILSQDQTLNKCYMKEISLFSNPVMDDAFRVSTRFRIIIVCVLWNRTETQLYTLMYIVLSSY